MAGFLPTLAEFTAQRQCAASASSVRAETGKSKSTPAVPRPSSSPTVAAMESKLGIPASCMSKKRFFTPWEVPMSRLSRPPAEKPGSLTETTAAAPAIYAEPWSRTAAHSRWMLLTVFSAAEPLPTGDL